VHFRTDYRYTDRETKARYVCLKYQAILQGHILDVGADECYLKQWLPAGATYWGIGLGGHPDQQVDLEKEGIPSGDNSFDCVLCLDVLEHVENIHWVFDELCRVTRRYVIVSLPNAYAHLYYMLCHRDYQPGQAMKFYGLPTDKPEDRHKWFFSSSEAVEFLKHRAAKSGMRIVQLDYEELSNEGWGVEGALRRAARRFLFRNHSRITDLCFGTLWAVFETDDIT
jgi:hypothetical protein